jgi:hypothetical protein
MQSTVSQHDLVRSLDEDFRVALSLVLHCALLLQGAGVQVAQVYRWHRCTGVRGAQAVCTVSGSNS